MAVFHSNNVVKILVSDKRFPSLGWSLAISLLISGALSSFIQQRYASSSWRDMSFDTEVSSLL